MKAQRLTWPIRSGVVPPLADCYNPRTETRALPHGHSAPRRNRRALRRRGGVAEAAGDGHRGKDGCGHGDGRHRQDTDRRGIRARALGSQRGGPGGLDLRHQQGSGHDRLRQALADIGAAEPGEDCEVAAGQFLDLAGRRQPAMAARARRPRRAGRHGGPVAAGPGGPGPGHHKAGRRHAARAGQADRPGRRLHPP